MPVSRRFHFSVDDVIDALIEVTDKQIPMFQHPTFGLFKELNDRYGLTVDLYLFYQKEINGVVRTLSEVRDLRLELETAGNFLRFGPHALDYPNPPHSQTPEEAEASMERIYKEIDRFAGQKHKSKELRLHFYSETYELADFFTKNGVDLLFSTDRAVGSYRLPISRTKKLLQKGEVSYLGTKFVRTHYRLEFLAEEKTSDSELKKYYDQMLSSYGYVVCYTHECELSRPEIRSLLEKSAMLAATW